MAKYNEHIMRCVRQNLGLKHNDTSKDNVIEEMDKMGVWMHFLAWEGIIGYEHILHEAHENIFGKTE